jgi:hypothetical protein
VCLGPCVRQICAGEAGQPSRRRGARRGPRRRTRAAHPAGVALGGGALWPLEACSPLRLGQMVRRGSILIRCYPLLWRAPRLLSSFSALFSKVRQGSHSPWVAAYLLQPLVCRRRAMVLLARMRNQDVKASTFPVEGERGKGASPHILLFCSVARVASFLLVSSTDSSWISLRSQRCQTPIASDR